ncbi:MAG: response regulator [Oligoflexia bacterium]|nr:response regulator [Oligoflexia bacterium]
MAKSERKRVEQEKGELQSQLLMASKLASVGELAAGITHEINNPLAIAVGMSEILHDRLFEKNYLDDQAQRSFGALNSALNRITKIINGVRLFARSNSDSVDEVMDINAILREVVSIVEGPYKQHGIRIELYLGEEERFFSLGNIGKLQQVIINLLVNAKDALEKKSDDRLIRIKTFRQREEIWILIFDNGIGIAKSILPRIFEPFYTTKEVGKGTGLGLSISHGIIKSFQGVIDVKSYENNGTSFTIKLPLAPAKTENGQAEATSENVEAEVEEDLPQKLNLKGKVLVVDDEKEIAQIISQYLFSFGLQVVVAENGLEALEKFKKEPFDCVLTDIVMPFVDGASLIEEVKKLVPAMKCIVLSGGKAAEYSPLIREKIEKFADHYLIKPASRYDIYKALQSALGGLSTPS